MALTQSCVFTDKSVLITGGHGFIGSHVTEQLIAAGAKVTVLMHPHSRSLVNLSTCLDRIECVHEDIVSTSFQTFVASQGFDVIFHFAARPSVSYSVEQPWDDFQANAVGTLRLLEGLRQSRRPTRLILASSAAVYGDIDSTAIREDDPTVPISPYGVSKLVVDRYATVYAQLYGLRIATLRVFSVYGPRQKKQVVYDLIRKLSHNTAELCALGDGTQIRDFSYATDVAQAALWVAQRGPLCGEAYNVASGTAYSIGQLLTILCELLGRRPRIHWSGTVRAGEPQRFLPDIARLRALGWRPLVPLCEGLRRTLAWYQAEKDTAENGGKL